MNQDKLLELQMQVRRNQEEMGDYARDLECWEDEIREKDEKLKLSKLDKETVSRNRVFGKSVF